MLTASSFSHIYLCMLYQKFSTDPETNLHSLTGYRCRTFSEFCWAARNIHNINPQNCRDWAMNNYSMDRIGNMYEHYFKMVYNVHAGDGWYQKDDHADGLEWLNRYYPGLK